MKALKLSLVIMAATMIAIGLSGVAYAFHGGGAARCSGCHSMHSSGGAHLVLNSDPSSTCLSCHEKAGLTGPDGYHVSTPLSETPAGTPPKQRTPGGDFDWVRKPLTGTTGRDGGWRGHNIIAADYGYTADIKNITAPGGTFPASSLACTCCHDPHGKGRRLFNGTYSDTGAPVTASGSTGTIPADATTAVGTYDLLAGPYYQGAVGVTYLGWAIAVRPSTYNQTEASNQVRVAYGSNGANTWGNWCGSCHPAMAATGQGLGKSGHTHPVDQALGTDLATNYYKYVKTGDMTGTLDKAYTSLVPFAEATGDITTLKSHAKNDNSWLYGPNSNDQVTCHSCHRSHASAFNYMMRWDPTQTFIVSAGAYTASGGLNATTEVPAGYYDRPVSVFANPQRPLCNKCHAKD